MIKEAIVKKVLKSILNHLRNVFNASIGFENIRNRERMSEIFTKNLFINDISPR